MRFLCRGTFVGALLAGSFLLAASPALAAETANSEFVVIRPGDVLEDDLYAGAVKLTVEGRIDGDLIVFAAEEVLIEGSVTGSVLAISPRVIVNGSVGRSLRVVSTGLDIGGVVGGDVVAAVLDADLGEDSAVEGEVLLWAMKATALGSLGSLEGSQRILELAGAVEEDVDVSVDRLRIVAPLEVGGDLGFRSENPADGLGQASVGGVIVDKTPLPPNIRVRALRLFARFLVVLLLTIAALIVAWGWPEHTGEAVRHTPRSPIRSWARGAVVMASPIVLAGLAGAILALAPPAAGLPLLAVFAPVWLVVVGLVAALALFAGAPVVGWLGGLLSPRLGLHGAILVGSVVVGVAWMLPVVGWLIPVIVLPLGLGTWARRWRLALAPRSNRTATGHLETTER